MAPADDRRGEWIRRALARVGLAASAFLVFACGYLAMQTGDWRRCVPLTLLAGLGGLAASAFARRAR
jgi:anti-sigma-K factor RskA